MKNAKVFTRRQKTLVSKSGYNPNEYLCLRETESEIVIIEKSSDTIISIAKGV